MPQMFNHVGGVPAVHGGFRAADVQCEREFRESDRGNFRQAHRLAGGQIHRRDQRKERCGNLRKRGVSSRPAVATYSKAMDCGQSQQFSEGCWIYAAMPENVRKGNLGTPRHDEKLEPDERGRGSLRYNSDPHTAVGLLAWKRCKEHPEAVARPCAGHRHPANIRGNRAAGNRVAPPRP